MLKYPYIKLYARLLLTTLPRKQACNSFSSQASPIKMKIVPVPPVVPTTYIKKNENLKRALSPHLTIYKTQITSMMSITLRLTGLAFGIAAFAIGSVKFFSGENVDYFVSLLEELKLDDCSWKTIKTLVAFPFAFHFVAGIRHLMFDTSKLLEKNQFYATGYLSLVLALALALCLVMMEDIRDMFDTAEVKEK